MLHLDFGVLFGLFGFVISDLEFVCSIGLLGLCVFYLGFVFHLDSVFFGLFWTLWFGLFGLCFGLFGLVFWTFLDLVFSTNDLVWVQQGIYRFL